MLTTALFLSAFMGIYQERIYTKHGKHANEALFYNVSDLFICMHVHIQTLGMHRNSEPSQ